MKNSGYGALIFIGMLVLISLLFGITYFVIEDTKKYSQVLIDPDCVFLASDKDLPQIKFYECKEEIKMFKNNTKLK